MSTRRRFHERWWSVAVAVAGIVLAGAAPACASFPGANGRIAFVRADTIWTARADGGDQRALVAGAAPAWSPDGRRLAFERDGQIWVMNADGTGETALTGADAFAQHPTWSPDGRIAYADGGVIWVMNGDGSDPHPVAPPPPTPEIQYSASDPDWTGTGEWIAFSYGFAYGEGEGCPCSNIGSVRPDGTGFLEGPSGSAFDYNYDPEFSPDGNHLAWTITGGHHGGSVVVVDGAPVTPLDAGTPGDWVASDHVAWSPDGGQVAYDSNLARDPSGRLDVYVTRLADRATTRVLEDATQPDWQSVAPLSCTGVTAAPRRLWPPDHRLHRVVLRIPADLSAVADVVITGVSSDEPPSHHGADFIIAPDRRSVLLRAERSPHGDGRTYTIAFTARRDGTPGTAAADTCDGTATVTVPRHP
jgi:WD40-like Beta Propeller Repeat